MDLKNMHLPEQDDVKPIVNEVDTHKQYPPYSITTTSNCDAVTGFTVNGYRTRKRQIRLADINIISGVDAGGDEMYKWHGKRSYAQIFGSQAESKEENVQHGIIYTNDGEIIIINDDIREFGVHRWEVTPAYDGEHIDAIFLPEADGNQDSSAYVPRDNALGEGFTLPPGFINPDIKGRYTTALFLPELYKDEHGMIHTVKSKVLASVIESVHLKSQFKPEQLATWPANVRDMFGALVVLNNGRLMYTTHDTFTSLNWVRPAQSRTAQGTLLPGMTAMPLPNRGIISSLPRPQHAAVVTQEIEVED